MVYDDTMEALNTELSSYHYAAMRMNSTDKATAEAAVSDMFDLCFDAGPDVRERARAVMVKYGEPSGLSFSDDV